MRHSFHSMVWALFSAACLGSSLGAAELMQISPGTKIPVRLERSVGTKDFYQWRSFSETRTVSGTLMQDLVAPDGQVALRAGTKIHVAVLESKRAGHITGRSRLRLGLHSLITADGQAIPLDGYPTQINHRKVDAEGTAHGKRGLVKDAAVDVSAVTTGAAAGFVAGGPPGAVLGAGGGLLVSAIWTVVRRGPDLVVPAGTIVEFVIGRPVTVEGTGEVVNAATSVQASTWGRGQSVPPSEDLLELAGQVSVDPEGVLRQVSSIKKFNERPAVDRIFVKYLQALARFQAGDHSQDTLKLMREAYREAETAAMPETAREEMARNLVDISRGCEPNWERDPLLNDPRVQAALVEEVR